MQTASDGCRYARLQRALHLHTVTPPALSASAPPPEAPLQSVRRRKAKLATLHVLQPQADEVLSNEPALGGALKRTFDIVASILMIAMVWSLLVGLYVAVRLVDGAPVLYSQTRVGRGGKLFSCWKFRTMVVDSHGWFESYLSAHPDAACEWVETAKLKDDPRVTRIGRFLRKTSLDELPQLLNILKGEMSFVGPRPVVADELVRYGAEARAYLRARPGLTGLWQVSGRNYLSYDRRIALDRHYVARWSMLLDIVILLRTAPVVLRGKGH